MEQLSTVNLIMVKLMKRIISLITLILLTFSLFSCSSEEKIQKFYYGEDEFDKTMLQDVKIEELINDANKYSLSFVSVEGEIATECSVGCWFFLKDDIGNQMYIDLSDQNFAIPQAVGHKVKVSGIFENRASNPRIIAYEVEFLDVKE